MIRRKRTAAWGAPAEALASALDLAAEGRSVSDPRVAVAGLLSPHGGVGRESVRAASKAAMLAAYDAAGSATAGEATDLSDLATHTARVDLPDGTTVRLADVEALGPDRAAAVALNIASLNTRAGRPRA